jgi:hypothetical protein
MKYIEPSLKFVLFLLKSVLKYAYRKFKTCKNYIYIFFFQMSMSIGDRNDHICWRFKKVNTDKKIPVLSDKTLSRVIYIYIYIYIHTHTHTHTQFHTVSYFIRRESSSMLLRETQISHAQIWLTVFFILTYFVVFCNSKVLQILVQCLLHYYCTNTTIVSSAST